MAVDLPEVPLTEEPGPSAVREEVDIADLVKIKKHGRTKYSRKWRMDFTSYNITVPSMSHLPFIAAVQLLYSVLQHVFATVLNHLSEDDYARFRLRQSSLTNDIWVEMLRKRELTTDRVLTTLERSLNSHQFFRIDGSFVLEVQTALGGSGGCNDDVKYGALHRRLTTAYKCIRVKNKDKTCRPRAIMISKFYADHPTPPQNASASEKRARNELLRKVRDGEARQIAMVRELVTSAELNEGPNGYNESHFAAFQNSSLLTGYRLLVISAEHNNRLLFKGLKGGKAVTVVYHNHHYDALTGLAHWFNTANYCEQCLVGYEHKEEHRCQYRCNRCFSKACSMDQSHHRYCSDCRRYFNGDECFNRHKSGTLRGSVIRDGVRKCIDCSKLVFVATRVTRKQADHKCGEFFCKACHSYDLPGSHQCFMQNLSNNPSRKVAKKKRECKYFFFDFETWKDSDDFFKPNFVSIQDEAGVVTNIPASGEPLTSDITAEFRAFLLQECHRNTTWLAHNFRSFDSYFLLEHLTRNGMKVKPLFSQSKCMQLYLPDYGIRFKDSLNFNPTALASWPKTFGIEDTSKGHFPHHFNVPENWTYEGPYPPQSAYATDSFSTKDKVEFQQWHTEKVESNAVFDFRQEIELYCVQDVTVLRKCAMKLRELFMQLCRGLDPFAKPVTISSACMQFYRTYLLKPKTIAIIPPGGYFNHQKQSRKALIWHEYLRQSENLVIVDKIHGGEKQVGRYRVDGYCEQSNTVYEFHGCAFHGCPTCFNDDTPHPYNAEPMSVAYEETLQREREIQRHYRLVVMWEHEYDQWTRTVCGERFLLSVKIPIPLQPRDAFYGERTDGNRLYWKSDGIEKGRYFDVTSLYPYINKYGRYPVGHPQIIVEGLQDMLRDGSYRETYGLIKCTILPPSDNCLFPVLPMRGNGKLLFTLCRTCALTQCSQCAHADDEQSIEGTWTTPELEYAEEKNYKVTSISEIWHYPETKVGLFAEYVDLFLKVKIEASGWPTALTTDEERSAFVALCNEKENIVLSPENIQNNPGLRSLAKLMLNSFWGKFGHRVNLPQSEIITQPEELFKLLKGKHIKVTDLSMHSDDSVSVTTELIDEFIEANPSGNAVVAAYTSALARLHLQKMLDRLGPRVLYYDTDSVMFTERPGDEMRESGDFLGEWKDELGADDYINEFVTLGSKVYAYNTDKGKNSARIKGMTQNDSTAETLNLEELTNVLSGEKEALSVQYPLFKKDKSCFTIQMTDIVKRLKQTLISVYY